MRRAALLALALLAAAAPARAEKADRDQPMQIEANRMSADDARRMTLFEGDVVVTKGTLSVRADRIVVRQDAEGFQQSTATGSPVRFKQRQDPKDGAPAQWMEGEAQRVELDERRDTIELFERARVARGGDQVTGEYIFVDQRSDFFSVSAGRQAGTGGRVRAILQPKAPAPPAAK